MHVDFVTNDSARHVQHLVGQVFLTSGHLAPKSVGQVSYETVMHGAIEDATKVASGAEPELILAALATVVRGSRLFASDPHSEADCPFQGREVLEMEYQALAPGEFVFD